jgi:lipopolysaccharide export system protein LptA
MKTLLISLLLISSTVFAQKKTDMNDSDNLQPSFSCQHFELQDHDNTFILKENVKITFGKLYVEADSAVYLDAEKALVAYNVKNLKFSGEAEIRDDAKQNTLRYSLDRDDVIYLE